MKLEEKLMRLQEKQKAVEAQIAAEKNEEDAAAARAAAVLLSQSPGFANALLAEKVTSALSKKDQALLAGWIARNAGSRTVQPAQQLQTLAPQ